MNEIQQLLEKWEAELSDLKDIQTNFQDKERIHTQLTGEITMLAVCIRELREALEK